MCYGGSLVDQGLSIRLLDAGWKEMVSQERYKVLKTNRTELMLEFSCFIIFEEVVRFIKAL